MSTTSNTTTPPAQPAPSQPTPQSRTDTKAHPCDPPPSGSSGDSGTGRNR